MSRGSRSLPGRRRRGRHPLVMSLALAALVAALLAAAAPASAHPLGNFTVNSYVRVEASGGELYLRHVIDMAEVPAFRERSRIDAYGGLEAYAAARARERALQVEVRVDGRRLAVEPVSQSATTRPGQGGLQVLRYAAWYRVPGAADVGGGAFLVEVRDRSYGDRLGWREMVVRPSSGAGVSDSSAPEDDAADELRNYPGDLLKSPLDVTEATFTWTPGSGAGEVGPLTTEPESSVAESSAGGLGGLVDDRLSVGVVLLALLLAAGWGALHSLSPGHGKAMVAAYLVGTRGTARHAVILGLFVTITHTLGVIALGLVTLFASRYILPETLYPWLNLAAALLVVAIGAFVAWRRFGPVRRRLAHARAHRLGRAHEQGQHHHGDGHHHDHGHDHGPGGHSHAPPDDLSIRSLMAVGASAGIIPCPSALVLLLGAIAFDRVAYGLLLVLAFSVGLAGLLSLVGLLVLYARRFVERLPLDGRLAAAAPTVSAVAIVVIGVVLTARALPGVL